MVIVGLHNRRYFHWTELFKMIQAKWKKIKLTNINSPEFMSVIIPIDSWKINLTTCFLVLEKESVSKIEMFLSTIASAINYIKPINLKTASSLPWYNLLRFFVYTNNNVKVVSV